MSSKLPWTRLFADKWLLDLACLPAIEGNVYMRLRLQMLRTREPLVNDAQILSHFTCCSVKRFQKALDYLFRSGHIILSEDGHLWCSDVEEELKNSDETLNKFAERAAKAANTRKHKNHEESSRELQDSLRSLQDSSRCLEDSSRGYNNNNINNNKKNKNIILSKREIDFENLETNDLVDEPIECDVESQSEQIKTIETKQPIIHEQNINLSNEVNNRWQINEAMIAKLPSRKVKKVGKKLSEIFDTMMPAYFPEKANFFEETKKTSEKQDVERILEDFKPDFQYATEQGLTHDEALSEFEKFVRFSKSNPCRNTNERDWQSAWDNWITHPEYGLVIKKHKKLETEKLYATACYKSSSNNFANNLSERFSIPPTAIYA
ncbi:hypothetical protein [Bartonella sp. SD1336NMGDW]|uniref:hypothetical protein n=1 Tax=Bartonella sp. SD1336NMGDW TaxID=3243575 RepID=UPI0035D07E3F